jgi:O-antigen biosynthesis protein
MSLSNSSEPRITLDGKFFRLGPEKFYARGVTYGPFAPDEQGETFGNREQAARDFEIVRELGANLLRVYSVPPEWFLELAREFDLRLFVEIPWNKHLCFLDSPVPQEQARAAVRDAVRRGGQHPSIFAFSLANEITPDVLRWSGARAVSHFLEELIEIAKEADPRCLCTFGNYPPTEFLRVPNIDFHCFNVYLHERAAYENYLSRLQMIADSKPIIIGEFGLDSIREGETAKSEILEWHVQATFRAGFAGTIIYSFTDDWHKDGRQIVDWAFGVTTRERQPKASFAVVRRQFEQAPYFPLPRYPKISVVVASYNGARTLRACLEALENLRYPDYEVILIDDGSTDNTPDIAANYPTVRYIGQPNKGLSAARNAGIAAARGEIVAFTDSDCRPDEDWLYYLMGDLFKGNFAGVGGPNFLPPEDSFVAAAVMASPGGPAHVMLTDRIAEHIPGCNMAFYKWALEDIGGFDPQFRKAGDDVDVCWRMQQRGLQLGFSPAGFVWHYRRSTVRAYLKQQAGYGEAEALLVRKHPEYFNAFGGGIWQGRIYTAAKPGLTLQRPIIYRGLFAGGMFQTLYTPAPAFGLMLCTSLEYHVLITLPLFVLSAPFPYLLPAALASLLLSAGVCAAAAAQAELPRSKRRAWSRPLIALLYFLQPICRGWARYQGRLRIPPAPTEAYRNLDTVDLKTRNEALDEISFWAGERLERIDFVRIVLARLDAQNWQSKVDSGWCEFDVEIFGSRWAQLQLTTVAEPYPENKQMVRCRLRTAWSLLAKVVFWGALGAELLLIGLFRERFPWIWMLLLTLPVFVWFIEQEERDLQRAVAVLLDHVAGDLGMKRVKGEQETAPVKHGE